MNPMWYFGIGIVASLAAWGGGRWWSRRTRTISRWYETSVANERLEEVVNETRAGLPLWLYRAGFRRPGATTAFVVVTTLATFAGASLAAVVVLSGLQAWMATTIVLVPGGVGETFLPVVWLAPWILFLLLASAPWVAVRRARQDRLERMEQDLPLALELLSTLSEAGLGFDASLARILRTRLADRPLAEDLRLFQTDLLAGRGRVDSLRRLAFRADCPSVSVFVSALVQAEQLGMGIARVLRQQAEDVRSRRRERALAFANALTVKRVIPLVVCFLPGLFVWTLGPAFVQLFKLAEAFIQVRDL